MSTLTRNDGTQFVMQAYRELLVTTKRSLLLQEIRLLAESQGQYVYVTKKDENYLEAVFSREPGYLFGETVWHYFGCPKNLIYCEALSNSSHVLVVVVRNSSVYFDAKIPNSNLRSELVPLMTEHNKYHIFTYGEVTLGRSHTNFGFSFPENLVSTFEQLDESLFPRLSIVDKLQLQSLPLVLKSEHLQRKPLVTVTSAIVIFVLLGSWWLYPTQKTAPLTHQFLARRVLNPYAEYFQAMATPSPQALLEEMAHNIARLYLIPGWSARHIAFDGHQYKIQLADEGGNLFLLNQWAKDHAFDYHLTSMGPQLFVSSNVKKRSVVRQLYSSDQVINKVVDSLDHLLEKKSVLLDNTQHFAKTKKVQLTVNLQSVSPDLLELLGRELSELPITINEANLTLRAGLVDGTIKIAVWGS